MATTTSLANEPGWQLWKTLAGPGCECLLRSLTPCGPRIVLGAPRCPMQTPTLAVRTTSRTVDGELYPNLLIAMSEYKQPPQYRSTMYPTLQLSITNETLGGVRQRTLRSLVFGTVDDSDWLKAG
jgi:hypothetical protein